MDLISLIVVLVVVGIILWLVNHYLPIDPKIKMIINILVVLFIVIWLLGAIGVLGSFHTIRIGR